MPLDESAAYISGLLQKINSVFALLGKQTGFEGNKKCAKFWYTFWVCYTKRPSSDTFHIARYFQR